MEQFDGSFRLAGSRDSLNATFSVANGALRVVAGEYEIGSWPLRDIRLTTTGDGIHILVEGEDLIVKMRDPGGFTEALGEASPAPLKKRRRRLRKEKAAARPAAAAAEVAPPPAPSMPEDEDEDDDVSVSSVRLTAEEPAPVASPPVDRDEDRFGPIATPTATPRRPLSKRVREARDIVEWKEWRRRLRLPSVRWGLAFGGVVVLLLIAIFATGTLGMLLTLIGMVSLILAALAVSDDPSVYRFLPARITETMLLAVGFVCLGVGLPLIFLA